MRMRCSSLSFFFKSKILGECRCFQTGYIELNRAFRVYLNLVHEFTAVERSCGAALGTTKFSKFSTAVVELY
eukprot:SAG11_NODE_4615_length_1833_cov_4.991926_1_plen_72_part_00